MRFSMSPRAQYSFSYRLCAAQCSARQRRDHKARIGFAGNVFGLGHHAPLLGPRATQRFVFELDKDSRRLLRARELLLRFECGMGNQSFQSFVARQSQHVVHSILLAPRHQIVVAKSRVAAHNDAHLWPAGADLFDNACYFLHASY